MEKKPSVSFERLLQAVAFGNTLGVCSLSRDTREPASSAHEMQTHFRMVPCGQNTHKYLNESAFARWCFLGDLLEWFY
jgi:hypothetical protein